VGDLNSYIESKMKPTDDRDPPLMTRFRCEDGGEYYIYQEYVLLTAMDRLFAARKEMRNHYLRTWEAALKQNTRPPEMNDDETFARSVEARLCSNDPVLVALLDYRILDRARQERGVPDKLTAEIDAIVDANGACIRPLPQVLNLDRVQIATDARLLVPFWQASPMINVIVTFLKRVLVGPTPDKRVVRRGAGRPNAGTATIAVGHPSGRRVGARGTAAPAPVGAESGASASRSSTPASRHDQIRRFRTAARDLGQEYVLPGSTPERTLVELIERWNPLLDPVAKEHLVEDINSLVRDFLRRMKVSFRLVPPTRTRVEEWADRLCENDAFAQIRREDDLRSYLKLYMLTLLSK
jgi:hypothetical protein